MCVSTGAVHVYFIVMFWEQVGNLYLGPPPKLQMVQLNLAAGTSQAEMEDESLRRS